VLAQGFLLSLLLSVSLQIEAPPELAAARMRLESLPRETFSDIAQFLGATESQPAIHVLLVPESSELARNVSPWISGFAAGESRLVVLFPARSPGYRDQTLEDVLRHEIAHVLIARAAAPSHVPRWFDEGLAMEVERQRRWQDQTELFYQLVTGGETDLQRLDGLFRGGQNDQTRAYALAGAFVHDLLSAQGPDAVKQILMMMHSGMDFDRAFSTVTSRSPTQAEADFWRRQRIWTSWVPVISSNTTMYLGVTLLALLAIYIRRRRNRELQEQWEKDGLDGDDDGFR